MSGSPAAPPETEAAMQTHPRKRIEILIEQPALARVLDALDRLEATGYTVTQAIAGKGREGKWRTEGLVSAAGSMVSVLCIADTARADAILEAVFPILERRIGLVTILDCAVIRPERF
jgi:nitrogen regulatory protein PII